jgi:hypothetical protein
MARENTWPVSSGPEFARERSIYPLGGLKSQQPHRRSLHQPSAKNHLAEYSMLSIGMIGARRPHFARCNRRVSYGTMNLD